MRLEDQEVEALEMVKLYLHSEGISALREVLRCRRERYRGGLERQNDDEVRGRAKECKDLLQILVDK